MLAIFILIFISSINFKCHSITVISNYPDDKSDVKCKMKMSAILIFYSSCRLSREQINIRLLLIYLLKSNTDISYNYYNIAAILFSLLLFSDFKIERNIIFIDI